MITIKKISKSQLAQYVDIAYRGDSDLMDRYHIQQHETVESAVFSTMLMIDDMSRLKDLSYYKICWKKEPIGYLVTFPDFLYSFGINIKFRKRDIHIGWWNATKSILGKKFISMLYDNNSRAVGFLQKQGMKILEHNLENHSIVLVCQ